MSKFLLKTPLKKIWKKNGLRKRAGVIFPLFSIYSKNSLGIGEIPDLKLAIDWCQITGNKILQILPINDTGFNFHPFSPQSSFALDPIYLSLRNLIEIKKGNLEKELSDLVKKLPFQRIFVNWRIKKVKIEKLWQVFLKRANLSSPRFKKFVKGNNYWLRDYCLFRVLKDENNEKSWEEWPDIFKNREKKVLKEFEKKNEKKIKFQQWLQWQLFEQLRDVKSYAQKKKIFLKGDLPHFVSRDSVDVWVQKKYFKLNFAAGAPPDLFSLKGQRWGMPPYDWDEILKDNFVYFKEKLRYAQNFYHLFRIDHIVGLFRTWSIPIEVPIERGGKIGFFDPRDEKTWKERGRKILKLIIKNTKMLPCGEDLGTVPIFCHKVLEELGIPGIDIQRWKKDWRNFQFLRKSQYRKISISTLSTHDLSNFLTWFEKEAGGIPKELFKIKCREIKIDFEKIKNKLFYLKDNFLFWKKSISEEKLIEALKNPSFEIIKIFRETYKEKEKFLKLFSRKFPSKRELIKKNLEFINSTSSIFSILLIFEWLFLGDILNGKPEKWRINFPGKISKKNFSLRLPISLEKLLTLPINDEIRRILEKTGRI